MKKRLLHIIPLLLALALFFALAVPAALGADADEPLNEPEAPVTAGEGKVLSREEVVYANLAADGSPELVYAVTVLEVEKAGLVSDFGSYDSAVNLTSAAPVELTGEGVSVEAEAGRLYYQGYLREAALPWDVSITYRLDGREVAASELAGASGAFEMDIATSRSEAADAAFYDNYMLQLTVTLDTPACSEVEAPGATAANAGADKLLSYTVMPGSDADITLSAEVVGFHMDGVQISALPLSMTIDGVDTSELTGRLDELSDAIGELNSGASKLSAGLDSLAGGAQRLTGGAKQLSDGLSSLANGSGELSGGSEAILSALRSLSAALSADVTLTGLEQLAGLPASLSQLSGGLRAASSGLLELAANSDAAYSALSSAVNALPSELLDLTVLQASSDPDVQALLGAYTAQYQAIMTLKGTFAQLEPLLSGLGGNLSGIAAQLNTMADALDSAAPGLGAALSAGDTGLEGLAALRTGVSELAAQYDVFHQGLSDYLDGVSGLSGGGASLVSGTASLSAGAYDAAEGASALAEGAAELYEGTGDLDSHIQEAVDDMLAEYDRSDFVPPSFVSARNTGTVMVQFVLKTASISVPEADGAPEEAAQAETLLDKLKNLF